MFTKLELEFIDYFKETEYCIGGGYVFHQEWNMKQTRGVISSLIQKDVIVTCDDYCSDRDYPSTWISLDMEYLIKLGVVLQDL